MWKEYHEVGDLNDIIDSVPPAIIDRRVMKLLAKKQIKQRTEEWYEKRNSILTASDCASAIGICKYKSRSQLIYKKAGIGGSSSSGPISVACAHGIKYEDEAANIYATRNPHLCPFFELGLTMHDTHHFLGASPDRITKDGILIEIKVNMLFSELAYA